MLLKTESGRKVTAACYSIGWSRTPSKTTANKLRLVSNVARTDAHRFYERKGMAHHVAHYFSMNLRRKRIYLDAGETLFLFAKAN